MCSMGYDSAIKDQSMWQFEKEGVLLGQVTRSEKGRHRIISDSFSPEWQLLFLS